jgi:hypothetical protein
MAIIVGDDGSLSVGRDDGDPTRASHRQLADGLAWHLESNQQVLEALDSQHRALAATVAELAATVATLEALMIGPTRE